MTVKAITANRLSDGNVVYLCKDGAWSERIQESVAADSEELAAALLELAKRAVAERLVVDPYLFAVSVEDGGIRPLGRREEIRAAGPSVRTDLGYQAAAE